MIRTFLFFTAVILNVLFFVPLVTTAQTYSVETEYRAVLFELIETLQKQVELLKTELENTNAETKTISSSFVKSLDVLQAYKINKPSDLNTIENSEHRAYFKQMFDLFPKDYDSKIKQLVVFKKGSSEYDAFVETLPPKHESWLFGVNEVMLDYVDSDSNAELIVHELAHIISYEEIIGLAKPAYHSCDLYFELYGCPAENSYLGQFVNEFWSEEDLIRAKDFSKVNNLFEVAYDYYLDNNTKFVSDYAVISPEEDFSETFMFFVLDIPVEGNLVKQKVDFMNTHSTLRSLKQEILDNL